MEKPYKQTKLASPDHVLVLDILCKKKSFKACFPFFTQDENVESPLSHKTKMLKVHEQTAPKYGE